MLVVTVNLTSAEWLQIHQAASQQWQSETLSRAEILRRYALIGTKFPKHEVKRSTAQLQSTMTVPGERRLRD